jgi:hypothetical protein
LDEMPPLISSTTTTTTTTGTSTTIGTGTSTTTGTTTTGTTTTTDTAKKTTRARRVSVKRPRQPRYFNQPTIGDDPNCGPVAVHNAHQHWGVRCPKLERLAELCKTNDAIGTAPQTMHFGGLPKRAHTDDVATIKAALAEEGGGAIVLFREFQAKAQGQRDGEHRPNDSVIHYAFVHPDFDADGGGPVLTVRNALVPIKKGKRGDWGFGDRVFGDFEQFAAAMLVKSTDLIGNSLPRVWHWNASDLE